MRGYTVTATLGDKQWTARVWEGLPTLGEAQDTAAWHARTYGGQDLDRAQAAAAAAPADGSPFAIGGHTFTITEHEYAPAPLQAVAGDPQPYRRREIGSRFD